jgi:hypothetical protein
MTIELAISNNKKKPRCLLTWPEPSSLNHRPMGEAAIRALVLCIQPIVVGVRVRVPSAIFQNIDCL